MRIRVQFSKYGSMRFVGHLDLMRYFQRALRRADINLIYTEGFNPHPILSFAQPLGIGLTSDGEYMDFSVNRSLSSGEALQAINAQMVEGVTVTGYTLLPDEAKKAMASVCAADYLVYFKHDEDFTQSRIAEGIRSYLAGRDVIEVVKETKKGERVINLTPLLYRFEPYADDSALPFFGGYPSQSDPLSDLGIRRGFFLRLCAGSAENIRPELVLKDFYRFMGWDYDPFRLQIHRQDLYQYAEESNLPDPVFRSLSAEGVPL